MLGMSLREANLQFPGYKSDAVGSRQLVISHSIFCLPGGSGHLEEARGLALRKGMIREKLAKRGLDFGIKGRAV